MDLSLATTRWQRVTVLAMVVITALVFWTAAPDTYGLPKATVLWVGALVLLVLGLVRAVWLRALTLPRSPWAIALGAFVVTVVITTLASPTLALSIVGEYNRYTGLLSYMSFAVAGFAVLRTFDVDEAALLLRILTALAVVIGAYGLVQLAGSDPLVDAVTDLGTVGTLGNANLLAGFMAVCVPASIWVALTATSPGWLRIVAAGAAPLAFAVAVWSKSFQGPAAAAPGALFVVAVWATTESGGDVRRAVLDRFGGVRRLVAAIVGVGVLLVGALAVAALPSGLQSGFVERGDFWRAALRMFGDRPLIGAGFDSYGQHFLAERPAGHAAAFGFTQAESAHSVPLNLLAGGGLLVFVAWLGLVVFTARSLLRGLRRLEGEERLLLGGLGGAWIAYLVQSLVSFDVPALALVHVALAASIVAIGTPPAWMTIRLPGDAVYARGRGRQERWVVPTSSYVAMGALVIAGVWAAWHATQPLRADLTAARANDQFAAGDREKAAASLVSATGLAPWQGRYWILRAQLDESTAEVLEAVRAAEEGARREPGSSQYALLAGQLNGRYHDADRAAPWYDEAVARDPNNPDLLGEVAAFEAARDPDRARTRAERAVELAPTSYVAWYGLGAVEEAAGNEDDAREAYERSVAIDENYLPAVEALERMNGDDAG